MFDSHHNHDHGHDHQHELMQPMQDPASQSLADALRVSFRLLSIIMLLVLAAFMLTGVRVIETQQVGIKKVFGRVVGTASQGLTFTWPFPVGDIEVVNTNEQTLTVSDLWLYETAGEKAGNVPMEKRSQGAEGLRPGWDGAVLTGDRSLLHVEIECNYRIQDALAYKKRVPETYLRAMDREVSALDEMIRTVVCGATIRSAATRRADQAKNAERELFAADIRQESQRQLDELLGTGTIRITKISTRIEWPLRALPSYQEAQKAGREAETKVREAISEADQMLKAAAGVNYPLLVGVPWETSAGQPKDGPYDLGERRIRGLIGQYIAAREAADKALAAKQPAEEHRRQADQLLAQIDDALQSKAMTGEVSAILSQAKTAYTRIVKGVEGRLAIFNKTLPGYLQSPQRTLELRWADVREDILSQPTVEKHYLTFDEGKTVLRLNADPEIRKQIFLDLLKAAKKDKEEKE